MNTLESFMDSPLGGYSNVTKTCSACKVEKHIREYSVLVRRHGDRDTIYSTCKSCTKKGRQVVNDWKRRNPLPNDYACPVCNWTHEDYLKTGRYEHQSPFSVDHCHETYSIRGYLCNPCNSAMGLAKHDPDILERLSKFLRNK